MFVIFGLYILMKGKNNLGGVLKNARENFQKVIDISSHNVSWDIPNFLHIYSHINTTKTILS